MPQTATIRPASERKLPELVNGDRLDQRTFHERYEAMPEHIKAELVEGIVYMASPVSVDHGFRTSKLNGWLEVYCAETPGVIAGDNITTILGEFCEVQPDACLAVLPEFGGNCKQGASGYLEGPPEFVAEVAISSESYDLHGKLRDYERAGVKEYLVIVVRQERVIWHVRMPRKKGFVEMQPDRDGLLKSRFSSGLWLDAAALLRGDNRALHDGVRKGCSTPEHAKFVETLTRRKKQ